MVWRAFELRPEPVPTLDPRGAYLERVWNSSVYPLAAQLGMPMKLPPVQPRSRLAHEAAKWAATVGRFDDFNVAVFRAFFERGEDIGDREVLAQLAANLGLDADALRRACDARAFEARVIADEREARELGISGVPAFVASAATGRRAALSGVQSVAGLQLLVAHVKADEPPATSLSASSDIAQ